MKKKLLVLLIAVIPAWMPNLASAIAIDVGEIVVRCYVCLLTDSSAVLTDFDF